MYLHVFSFSSSNCKFLAGSKFLSNRRDWNLNFLPRFILCELFRFELFFKLFEVIAVLVLILALKFKRCALPITAFLLTPPIISAIWLAVLPLPHKSFNILELDNGHYAAQPNNRVIYYDKSLTPSETKQPDFKVSTEYYSVENKSKWTAGDDTNYFYNLLEQK